MPQQHVCCDFMTDLITIMFFNMFIYLSWDVTILFYTGTAFNNTSIHCILCYQTEINIIIPYVRVLSCANDLSVKQDQFGRITACKLPRQQIEKKCKILYYQSFHCYWLYLSDACEICVRQDAVRIGNCLSIISVLYIIVSITLIDVKCGFKPWENTWNENVM